MFIFLPLPSNFCSVSKSLKAFRIPFVGLKLGVHTYEFDIDKAFFDSIEYSMIHDGDLRVTLDLDKKETMLVGQFHIEGSVFTPCDRCNDPLEVPVNGDYRIIFKFGSEISDDENLVVLPEETYELDVVPQLYELISVSLPARCVHEPGECNEEMMELYNRHIVNPGDPEDEDDDWDDDEDWDDDDYDGDDDPEDDGDEPATDGPIDPRWSALKNLN
jgi:uncharacterized protein